MPKPVDHLQVAKNNLTIPNGITPEQYSIRVATAQAAATVALVEQQETANLIALWNLRDADAVDLNDAAGMTRQTWDALGKNIAERLGLA